MRLGRARIPATVAAVTPGSTPDNAAATCVQNRSGSTSPASSDTQANRRTTSACAHSASNVVLP